MEYYIMTSYTSKDDVNKVDSGYLKTMLMSLLIDIQCSGNINGRMYVDT